MCFNVSVFHWNKMHALGLCGGFVQVLKFWAQKLACMEYMSADYTQLSTVSYIICGALEGYLKFPHIYGNPEGSTWYQQLKCLLPLSSQWEPWRIYLISVAEKFVASWFSVGTLKDYLISAAEKFVVSWFSVGNLEDLPDISSWKVCVLVLSRNPGRSTRYQQLKSLLCLGSQWEPWRIYLISAAEKFVASWYSEGTLEDYLVSTAEKIVASWFSVGTLED